MEFFFIYMQSEPS